MRPKVSHALANLLMSLCIAVLECVEGSIVSEEHLTHKYSFDFGLGTDPSHVEEFTVGACMEVHTVSEGFKGKGLEEREKDSKECRRVLHGLKTQPCFTPLLIGKGSEVDPSKDTVSLMYLW